MLKLEQALLVEGKYDAARLSNIVDGTILTTDGFRVFKDGALQRLMKAAARKRHPRFIISRKAIPRLFTYKKRKEERP